MFSPSRRPRSPAVVAPVAEATPQLPSPNVREPLNLELIGAVVSETDAIAVFVDRTNRSVVRLRKGEAHNGWELSSVAGREATLRNGERTESLVLLKPETPIEAPAAALPVGIGIGGGGPVRAEVPFVPRSTPKNGESDGL
jgi:general secretion pathway protein N